MLVKPPVPLCRRLLSSYLPPIHHHLHSHHRHTFLYPSSPDSRRRRRPFPPSAPPNRPTNPTAESILLSLAAPPPSAHRRDLDDLFKAHNPTVTSEFVLQVLANYKQIGRAGTLEFFSWAGEQLAFRFDDTVVEYMADFLGRRKLFDDLRCLLRTAAGANGLVSARAVATCIRYLGRAARVEEAMSLFEAMETELHCAPDNLVFNNVLYVLCRKSAPSMTDLIDVAIGVFRRIKAPDEYSYSNIIIGLCRFGRVETAVEFFHEMSNANLVPRRSAANLLIGELCELGAKDNLVGKVMVNASSCQPFVILVPNAALKGYTRTASEVFQGIRRLGLLPSAFVVNQLALQLCQEGMIDEVVNVLKMVGDEKARSFEESYVMVIKMLCGLRRMEDACSFFKHMTEQGLKPDAGVYNSIVCAFCKLGNLNDAEECFSMMRRLKCRPDSTTYTMLIHAYCVAGLLQDAFGLLMEMIKLGICPHFHTYNLVDSSLKNNGRLDLSSKLEGEMEVMTLLHHCKAGRLEAAHEKLSIMLAKESCLPCYARHAIERALRRSGQRKMAQGLLEKVDQIAFLRRFQA